LQEALSNAVRHSRATIVDVVLKIQSGMLTLDIKDNGQGFNPEYPEIEDAGIGLYTIRERVELLGGIIRIKSSDKIGTHVFIEVPIE
jgi:two-component system sensor histidine kinase DegS